MNTLRPYLIVWFSGLVLGLGFSTGPLALAAVRSPLAQRVKMTKLAANRVTMDLGEAPPSEIAKPLRIALNQVLVISDEIESPLNNAREVALASMDGPAEHGNVSDPDQQWDLARTVLRDHFNRETTQLVLLEEGREGRGFAPERGEDVKKNWVFSLVIPSLSDHIYWIVVTKDRVPRAYVYGFN